MTAALQYPAVPPAPLADGVVLSAAELRSATLDGELWAIGDAFLPVDAPITAVERAQSLEASRQDGRLFPERLTAAWIHGWCTQPVQLTFAVSVRSRVSTGMRRRSAARELVIDEGDTVTVGGVRVTSPVRTLLDLARESDDALSPTELAHLVRASGITVSELLTALRTARRAPHATRARRRLSAVADAIDVVNGVDAPDGVQDPIEMGHVAHFEDKLADRQAVA